MRIVDWRHAPISRLFYRYQQGDEYEEEIAGRVATRRGRGAAHGHDPRRRARSASTRRRAIFDADARRTAAGAQVAREAPRLAGGEGAALRVHDVGRGRRSAASAPTRRAPRGAPTSTCPTSPGLIDPEQFELITRPSAGFVVIRGTAGSGKTTVALHRIAYLAYDDPAIDSDARCSSSSRRRCATT